MTARRSFDPSVYLVFDPTVAGPRDGLDAIAAAVAGGATLVQFRDKQAPTRRLIARARAMKVWLARVGVPFIVNDRVDVALAVEADGVHLGQDDMPPAEARRLLGPAAIIGASAADLAELAGIDPAVVDYVGIGPVFATLTKPDAGVPLEVDGFAAIRRALPLPSVAIGGISVKRVADLVHAGADGIAVVSAICAAADPASAARELTAAIAAARLRHGAGKPR